MATKTSSKQGTTDVWKDSLGQDFRPGDLISVSVINGRSPQMVVAVVERINTTNPKGVPHVKRVKSGEKEARERVNKTYIGPELEDLHGPHIRTSMQHRRAFQNNAALQRDPANWRIDEPTTYYVDLYHDVPNVTVTARPILDGRGFSRSDARKQWRYTEGTGYHYVEIPGAEKSRPVTYTLIGNIVRLPREITIEQIAKLAENREVEY